LDCHLGLKKEKALPNGNGDGDVKLEVVWLLLTALEKCAIIGLNKSVPYLLSASLI
jgi:hypothetical protein